MREKMPEIAKDLSKIFKALGNERRVWILRVLFNWQAKELSVGDIADKIGLSLKSTSKHLQQLETAGLLEKRQEITSVLYSISAADRELHQYLKSRMMK